MTFKPIVFSEEDRRIYTKYAGLNLPRHTSYPIAPVWQDTFQGPALQAEIKKLAEASSEMSLYIHVPYCQRLCYYCGCTKEIMGDRPEHNAETGRVFLANLGKELNLINKSYAKPTLSQIHFGGGSPTFLNCELLDQLFDLIEENFKISADAEIAVEVDPRITSKDQLKTLVDRGLNRVSLGVQDFNDVVQKAVNRIQSFEMVKDFVAHLRTLPLKSVNFDLIYGLPFQTLASMTETLKQVISLAPDRIAFYRLAHIPEMFKWQKSFKKEDMPDPETMANLFILAYNTFGESGYEFMGLDHFARSEEMLSRAKSEGSVQRNFQGITTGKEVPILGVGPSAISSFGNMFAQNVKKTASWVEMLNNDSLATERGMLLSHDDMIRAEVIQQIYCHGAINKSRIQERFNIDFDAYFASEISKLAPLKQDGIIVAARDAISLTKPRGIMLARVLASIFDIYWHDLVTSPDPKSRARFSTVG